VLDCLEAECCPGLAGWVELESCLRLGCCPKAACWLAVECFLEPDRCIGLVSLGTLAAVVSALGAVGRGFMGDLGDIEPRGLELLAEEGFGSTKYRP